MTGGIRDQSEYVVWKETPFCIVSKDESKVIEALATDKAERHDENMAVIAIKQAKEPEIMEIKMKVIQMDHGAQEEC